MLFRLPNELHRYYADHLDAQSLSRLSRTCKFMRTKFQHEMDKIKNATEKALTVRKQKRIQVFEGNSIPGELIQEHDRGEIPLDWPGTSCLLKFERLKPALQNDEVEELRQFLEAKGSPNLRFRTGTPLLHYAMRLGGGHDARMVRLLLDYGARPNDLTPENLTALDYGAYEAPRAGDEARMKLVLLHGGVLGHPGSLRNLYAVGQNGSQLVRMALVNGTNLRHTVQSWGHLLDETDEGDDLYTTEQLCELVHLAPDLLTWVTATGETALDYIMGYRPAVAVYLQQTGHPMYVALRQEWIEKRGRQIFERKLAEVSE
ncbi:uncharacterized protein BP01DRAFT_385103 [Aspergillus saccharolyticus JOP 1030-1]|uniref:F-box domain-containing protein n=1 Tax=Aspergillus saccharolyticus JOP 1030-1 TaxID=1450539 RepID=A0A318ZDZ3_9EURO|nr:hypothetical protein BP01DRAFT_385103 [Aspergillus saccharolyticus JOP 1030-1]PYH42903.1 hypothetical protein BP01DRAFT_385103 [Aspergillus saccharolyticus JOP 1030-1]